MTRHRLPIGASEKQRILSLDGVTSIGMGLFNGESAIIIGVDSEQAAAELSVPETLGGFPVAIEIEGAVRPAQAEPPVIGDDTPQPVRPADAQNAERERPVTPGVSLSHEDGTAGTSGFVATNGSEMFLLSNNHVISLSGEASPGDGIIQPGVFDGGDVPGDRVGSLTDWIEFESAENRVDLAWYTPEGPADIDSTPALVDKPISETTGSVELGDDVLFVGRSSAVQRATVDRVDVSVDVQMTDGAAPFVDQFRLDEPLIPGDSGAPVYRETDSELIPIGMGFAATENVGYAMPVEAIEAESGLSITSTAMNGDTGSDEETDNSIDSGESLDGFLKNRSETEKTAIILAATVAGAWTLTG